MSNNTAHKNVQVTEQDAKTFYNAQESLIKKAIKNLDILDRQIKRVRTKIQNCHKMVTAHVKAKKQSEESDNILKINMNIIRISLKAKKEQTSLKRLNIIRKGISEKMNELIEALDNFKDVAELKGINL